MKRTILSFIIACSLLGKPTYSIAQTNNQKSKTMETVKAKQSKEVVQGFFTAFGSGDFDGVINSFHDSCKIVGIRDSERVGNQVYGAYSGKEGAKMFLTNLGNAFDTKAFSVENIIGDANVAFANGKFTHIVKSTGKSFSSDWALMCIVRDDKIFEYHFTKIPKSSPKLANRFIYLLTPKSESPEFLGDSDASKELLIQTHPVWEYPLRSL